MFRNVSVLQGGVVSTSPNPQAGGPPLVGCPRLLIQFIRSYPPYRRPFLYPQPEDVPCRGDRDPLHRQGNIWLERKPHYKELDETLKHQPGDQIKKVMGVACSTYGGGSCIHGFGGETWRKENIARDGGIMKRAWKEIGWVGVEWNDLAQYT